MVHGLRSMVDGLWFMVYGLCSMVYRSWFQGGETMRLNPKLYTPNPQLQFLSLAPGTTHNENPHTKPCAHTLYFKHPTPDRNIRRDKRFPQPPPGQRRSNRPPPHSYSLLPLSLSLGTAHGVIICTALPCWKGVNSTFCDDIGLHDGATSK